MALDVGPGGGEVGRRRFDRHEQQLHRPAGGVVDKDQQCAGRRPVFEPRVFAPVAPAAHESWQLDTRWGTTFEFGPDTTLQLGRNSFDTHNPSYVKSWP